VTSFQHRNGIQIRCEQYHHMNKIYITIILLFTSHLYGQDFKVELGEKICECFEREKEIKESTLTSCFTDNAVYFETELEKMIDKTSDVSEYEQGKILGRQLFFDMQNSLIQNCDLYYEFFDNMREESRIAMKDVFSQSTIDSLDILITENKTTELLWERGNAYFYQNKLEKAEKDYTECIEINNNHIQSLFFLGWVNERQGNFTKAIELYEKIIALTNNEEIILFLELAKRKSKL
jgi:tetratricopeptide (TPR) repeat protein